MKNMICWSMIFIGLAGVVHASYQLGQLSKEQLQNERDNWKQLYEDTARLSELRANIYTQIIHNRDEQIANLIRKTK